MRFLRFSGWRSEGRPTVTLSLAHADVREVRPQTVDQMHCSAGSLLLTHSCNLQEAITARQQDVGSMAACGVKWPYS